MGGRGRPAIGRADALTMGDGLVTLRSAFDASGTLERVLAALRRGRQQVFATIDHAEAARAVGLAMPPTVLVMFGSPKAGTPLMTEAPTLAIDLPLKMLVWEDAGGGAWVTYNKPAWLIERHGLAPAGGTDLASLSQAMADRLAEIARQASSAAPS